MRRDAACCAYHPAVGRPPDRRRDVFFLGAGFSCAAGLPNTAQLLTEAHALSAAKDHWGISKRLEERLTHAYRFFYPSEGEGFRPEVVDFFSVLSSYLQIDQGGLPDGFADRQLLQDLRFAIVHVLCERLRALSADHLDREHPLLDRMISRGNVVITTNWDTVIERACAVRKVPLRLQGDPSDDCLLLLKLHGSIDWVGRDEAKKPVNKSNYSLLAELLNTAHPTRRNLGSKEEILRVRTDREGAAWQTIKGASSQPFMVTMSPGKADSLGPVLGLWANAYRGISSASNLEIIGYSMPHDDIEIRTLLRAGVLRGVTDPSVIVWNPAPDVHIRIREYVHGGAVSDYTSVPALM